MVPVTLSLMFIISVLYIDVVSVHKQILQEEEQCGILLDEIINGLSEKGIYILIFENKSGN